MAIHAPESKDFRTELASLINRHSLENGSNTPDFILADYLVRCLATFDECVLWRQRWSAPEPIPEPAPEPVPEPPTPSAVIMKPPSDLYDAPWMREKNSNAIGAVINAIAYLGYGWPRVGEGRQPSLEQQRKVWLRHGEDIRWAISLLISVRELRIAAVIAPFALCRPFGNVVVLFAQDINDMNLGNCGKAIYDAVTRKDVKSKKHVPPKLLMHKVLRAIQLRARGEAPPAQLQVSDQGLDWARYELVQMYPDDPDLGWAPASVP